MKAKSTFKSQIDPQSLTPSKIAQFLCQAPLLHGVSEQRLLPLAQRAKVVSLPKSSLVFRNGEPSNWIYFVYSGFITEFVDYSNSMNIIVKMRKPHDYIGEMAVLSGSPYLNTAVAMDDVILLGFSKEAFWDMLALDQSVWRHIINELIERLTSSAKKMVNTMYLDAPARLAFTLVSLSGDMAGHHHTISITQSDLAAASGTARQTVATILGQWRKSGYIATERGRLTIVDVDALLNVISQCEINRL